MNTRSCEYLLAIAAEGTLMGAARKLGVSQPTLSAFLAKTEKQLGKALFTRTGRALVANDAGRLYLDYCRRILEIKQRTYHSISMLNPDKVETLRIGFTPHRGAAIYSTIYWQFCQRWPHVKPEPHEAYAQELRQLVDSGGIDFALGTCTEQDEQSYTIFTQYKQEILFVVPSSQPMARQAAQTDTAVLPADLRDFRDVPFVLWAEGTVNRSLLKPYFERAGFAPTEIYAAQNLLLMDTMLSSGAGAGFLPSYLCTPNPNRVYFSLDPPLYSTVCIFGKKGRSLTKAQRYFCYLVVRNGMLTADAAHGILSLNAPAEALMDEFRM